MKLSKKNLYIKENEKGYIVCIEMPDGSRNYLHNDPVKELLEAIWIVGDFDGDTEIKEVEIIKDGTYYRLELDLVDGRGSHQKFHSRKLNLNDVVYERGLLVG